VYVTTGGGFLPAQADVRAEVFVGIDATDVGSADGYHAAEAVFPPAEEGDTFVEDEEVFKAVCDVGRDGE
jgi:hypothetical protein